MVRCLTPILYFTFINLIFSGCASIVTPNVQTEARALRAGEYKLDETHASLIFRINHLGFSDYLGRLERFDASLDFDADNPTASKIDAVIDLTSLDIANDSFAETLMGPDWFDTARYPQAQFVGNNITITGENAGILTGQLTLHGVTKPISLNITFNGGARDILRNAYVVGFSANGIISRTAFGIERFSGVITDEVRLEIEAEFIRQ